MSENPPELNALRFYITKRYGAEAEDDIMREATRLFGLAIASTKEQCAAVADAVKLGGDDAVQKLKERGMPHEWSDGWIASADRIAAAIRSLQITATPNPKRE